MDKNKSIEVTREMEIAGAEELMRWNLHAYPTDNPMDVAKAVFEAMMAKLQEHDRKNAKA